MSLFHSKHTDDLVPKDWFLIPITYHTYPNLRSKSLMALRTSVCNSLPLIKSSGIGKTETIVGIPFFVECSQFHEIIKGENKSRQRDWPKATSQDVDGMR